jgi:hypothetical protein
MSWQFESFKDNFVDSYMRLGIEYATGRLQVDLIKWSVIIWWGAEDAS